MATICGQITAGFARDCDNKPIAGVKPRAIYLNIQDIASVTRDATNPLIVTGITLKSGKQGYAWEVYKRGHKPNFIQVDDDYGTMYRHQVPTSIQIWDNATKAQIEGLATGYGVMIMENLQQSGDARFEIYGLEAGLRSQDGATRDLAANGGVFTTTMANDEDVLESRPPASFAVSSGSPAAYSYSATLAAVEALLEEAD
jgi:hypothetical protein